jgi:hypothetical protein
MMGITDTKAVIRRWYARLGFPAEFDEAFFAALETVSISPDLTAEDFDWDSQDGIRNLLSVLYLCEALEQHYQAMGIPEEILLDTLGDIVRWAKTWSEIKGELFLGELCWLKWHFRKMIFKLGRLQFLTGFAKQDIPGTDVRAGDPVLEIHIPRTGPLDPQSCAESIGMAPAFFAKYFPEHHWKLFTCNSWLLDDTLKEILPSDSNIIRFQNLFTPVSKAPSDVIGGFVFRWKATREQVMEMPTETSLKKAIVDRFRNGGSFYVALGYIPK